MTDIVERLRIEERRHRDGFPCGRREAADLMDAGACKIAAQDEEIAALRAALAAYENNPLIVANQEGTINVTETIAKAVTAEREACANSAMAALEAEDPTLDWKWVGAAIMARTLPFLPEKAI